MDWCAGDGVVGDDETDLGRTDCLGRQEDSVEHPDGVLERVEVRPDEGTILPGIVSRSPRSHRGSSSTIHENAVMLSYFGLWLERWFGPRRVPRVFGMEVLPRLQDCRRSPELDRHRCARIGGQGRDETLVFEVVPGEEPGSLDERVEH
jgi:hypothetical protein